MGASAQRPTSSTPGSGGSGFYENALNQQKQTVANVPATQAAQSRLQDQYKQQQRPPSSAKGITMGAGYSNRPFS